MSPDRCRPPVLNMLALLAFILIAGGDLASAQDFDDEDAEENVAAEEMGIFQMYENQLSAWMFGNVSSAQAARQKLESQLTLQLDDLARICDLDEDQRAKLRLAGAGDLKRFFDRVDEKRAKYLNKSLNQNEINDVYQDLQAIRTAYNANLFSERSLYGKTIKRTLESSQLDLYHHVIQDRLNFRYRAKIELSVALMARSLGLKAEQRRELIELITAETRTPRRFGQQDNYFILYQLGLIPEEKLRLIFDDAQWKVLQGQMQNGRAMEAWLRQNGYDLDEGDDSTKVEP